MLWLAATAAMVFQKHVRAPPPQMATQAEWLDTALQAVQQLGDLTPKNHASEFGLTDSVTSYEAPGKVNLAWCSALGHDAPQLTSLTCFVGPLTDVPHLIAACGVVDGAVELLVDFRVRADCAYLPPPAEYAEPDTREAFAQGSNRKDFAAAFFTPEVEAWRDALLSLDGAEPVALDAEKMALVSASPVRVELRLPNTDEAAAAAAEACLHATRLWVGWMLGADEMKRALPAGAKQTQTYARDTKLRAVLFGELLARYERIFGDDEGRKFAEADAGPLDEAYVGGAS